MRYRPKPSREDRGALFYWTVGAASMAALAVVTTIEASTRHRPWLLNAALWSAAVIFLLSMLVAISFITEPPRRWANNWIVASLARWESKRSAGRYDVSFVKGFNRKTADDPIADIRVYPPESLRDPWTNALASAFPVVSCELIGPRGTYSRTPFAWFKDTRYPMCWVQLPNDFPSLRNGFPDGNYRATVTVDTEVVCSLRLHCESDRWGNKFLSVRPTRRSHWGRPWRWIRRKWRQYANPPKARSLQ